MFPQENPRQEHATPKPKWRHNGKRCPLVIREKIINALAAGSSRKAIALALHVSPSTVDAVAKLEWVKLDQRKARIAAQFEHIATKSCDLLAQKLETDGHKLTANQLVPIAGVAADKLLVLRGDANVIAQVDHTVHIGNIFEAFQQFHADARKIIQARQATQAEQPPSSLALPEPPPATPDPPQANS
jgi:hypothetical protein